MQTYDWDRVQTLFLTAADLPPGEQERFLDTACAGDGGLRAEVASLLTADRKNGAGISAAVETEASMLFEVPMPGDRLGAYRIVDEIGHGGMGAVYLATRADDQYHKQVAIKVVKRGMDTSEVLARFRYERQILANLDHPYIASLHDGGTTADGRPFFVMEFVEGQPVNVYCREHGLDTKARCRLFLKICEAVAHAHRNLVIHRDLKPANILITAEEAPKLLDFGLAKLLDGNANRETTMAMARHFTPDYASPEQVHGLLVTTATDIYSLGAILYELLTGHRAHQFADGSVAEMQRIVCETEIPPPVTVARDLDPDLNNIILMAMRKEPERRYQSVDQFAEDVRKYLDSRPVLARKDSLWYRTAKFARRKRYTLAAGAAVLASLIIGIVIAFSQARDAKAARRTAELNRDAAVNERQRAEQRLGQITNLSDRLLSEVYALMERLPGALPARTEFVNSMLDLLGKLSKEAENDNRLKFALAKAYLLLGDLQGDPDSANIGDIVGSGKSYKTASVLLGPISPTADGERLAVWADVQHKIGKNLVEMGDRTAARTTFENAIRAVDQSPKIGLEDAARLKGALYLSLARATFELPLALELTGKAFSAATVAEKRFPDDTALQLLISSIHTHAGYVHILKGEPEAAARPYEESIRIRERLYREHPTDQLFRRYLKLAYEHYAGLQGNPDRANLGHPEIARLYYRKARPLEEIDFADPQNSTAKFDYALYLMTAARVEPAPGGAAESLRELRKAAASFESLSAAEPGVERYSHAMASAGSYIGDRLLSMGKYTEALTEYQRSLKIIDRLLAPGPGHPTLLPEAFESQRGVALAMMLSGNPAGALQQARELLVRAETGPPETRVPHLAEADLTIAKVYEKLGDCDQAKAAAERSAGKIHPLVRPAKGDPYRRILQEAQSILGTCSSASTGAAGPERPD